MYSQELKSHITKEFDKEKGIVAYLDILGFEGHVKRYINPKHPQDKDIINNITSAMDTALKHVRQNENKALNLVRYKIFSDCTSLSVADFQGTEGEATMLCLLTTIVKSYNFHLIDKNIYLRGGIAVGFHHEDDNMIFSQALIKAYYLEKKKATHPRVILDEELVKRFERLWIDEKQTLLAFGLEKLFITDEEGVTFINPFNPSQTLLKDSLVDLKKQMQFKTKKKFQNYLDHLDETFNNKVLRNVDDNIEKFKDDESASSKYLWLKDLIDWNMNVKTSKKKFEYLLKSE